MASRVRESSRVPRSSSPASAILVATLCAVALALSLPATSVLANGPGGHGQGVSSQSSAAGPGAQNDAGSGGDAGDTLGSALPIASAQRTWNANLTPAGTDSDWYVVPTGAPFCAETTTTTQAPGSLALTGSGSLDESVRRPVSPHGSARLALAGTGGDSPRLGVLPASLMTSAAATGGPPSPGHYRFTFTSQSYAQLDPEGDGENPEAGGTALTSAALPRDCAAGRLGAGDDVDRYHFDVQDVRDLTFSFAVASGDAASLSVLKPDGTTFATLQSGGVADVWADVPGRWSVVVSHPVAAPFVIRATGAGAAGASESLATSYLIGVTDGPDPEPCRPSCVG